MNVGQYLFQEFYNNAKPVQLDYIRSRIDVE